MKQSRILLLLTGALIVVFAWSGYHPADRFTWVLEVFPVVVGFIILAALYPRFKFTTLVYVLIALHMIVLMIGGKYTYAEVPPFNWLKEHFHLARNYYDRVGHLFQGFVPALIAREVLLRKTKLEPGGWLSVTVVSMAMSISVCYEFFEWWVAVGTGAAADAFLGTQGDVWDTQWDMFMATCGAILALLLLSKIHDRLLRKMSDPTK